MHSDFLSTYGLSASDVPLVTFQKDDQDAPFRCEVCGDALMPTQGGVGAGGASRPQHTGDVSSLGYG